MGSLHLKQYYKFRRALHDEFRPEESLNWLRLFKKRVSNNPIPRRDELRALHGKPILEYEVKDKLPGWFETMITYSGVTFDAASGSITKANGHSMSATKWLSVIGVNEERISQVGKVLSLSSTTLTLSTAYKDIVRCSHTRHFSSCWRRSSTVELLARSDVAILLKKDKHGDIEKRFICFWSDDPKGIILAPRPYPEKDAEWTGFSLLPKKLPIFRSDRKKYSGVIRDSVLLTNHILEKYTFKSLDNEFINNCGKWLTPVPVKEGYDAQI